MIKTVKVDTKIYHHERENSTLERLQQLAPFGQGNPEPCFLIEDIEVQKIEKVGTNGKSHLKIHGKIGDKTISSMFRGKGAELENITNTHVSIVGKIKKDTYNGGFFIDIADIV
jgi:single-stranded-DNA-specific exonuclease